MIQYSGGSYIDTTATPTTRGALVNLITQALLDAGWTTISGTPGSGADVIQETAVGNRGQKVRVRTFDPATGNCAQVFLRAVAGSPVSVASYIIPASVLWRVIANKFSFFAFQSGAAARTTPRAFVSAGALYVPNFLNLVSGEDAGWLMCTGVNDADASPHTSWRNCLRPYDTSVGGGTFIGLYQTNMMTAQAYTTNAGSPGMAGWQGGYHQMSDNAYRWHDDSAFVYEPLLAWGITSANDDQKLRGQLYDAMVVNGRYASETLLTYDGHNWRAITDNTQAAVSHNGTLFVCVS